MSVRKLSAALLIGAAVITMSGSAAWAQSSDGSNPVTNPDSSPVTGPDTSVPGSDSTNPVAPSVETPGSDQTGAPDTGLEQGGGSEADNPSGPVADSDVFGFDISSGATGLTAEQLTAARNTCNQDITAQPTRYSAEVKTFCEQIR